jgi:hypothetical protein
MTDKVACEQALQFCRGQIKFVRSGTPTAKCGTDTIWRIITDLERVGATPEDVGSSFAEFEQLLQYYS